MATPTLTRTVAQNVSEAIREAGLTTNSVSKGTGIPLATLQRRLKGIETQSFTVAELGLIADYLDMTVTDLVA